MAKAKSLRSFTRLQASPPASRGSSTQTDHAYTSIPEAPPT
jgi:hypothetical protein